MMATTRSRGWRATCGCARAGLGAAVVLLALNHTAGCSSGAQDEPVKVAPKPKPAEPDRKAEAAELFDEVQGKLEKIEGDEKVDEAWLEEQLEKILRLDKTHKLARFNLAVLHERRDEFDKARRVYEELKNEDPEFVPAVENHAKYVVDDDKTDEAVRIYRQIVENDTKNQTSRLALARILLAEKEYAEAIKLCRQVLQRRADAVEAFRVLAWSYKNAGNTPMAELTIGRGLKVDPKDVELHYIMSQILLQRDDLAAGINKLKEVIRMDPKRLGVRAQLADVAVSYRDFGNAAQQYEAILKEVPDHRGAKLGLAVSYKGLGRFEQAGKIYEDLLKQDAADVDVLWNVGVLYHRHLRKHDEAIAAYRRFKEVAPPGAKEKDKVDRRVVEIEKTKSDLEAARLQAEREQKLREAISAVCGDVAAGKPPKAERIGNDQERIQVAWQLMVDGQATMEAGDVAGGEALIMCAFGAVPDTPKAATEACAPMRIMWTQILYQLGRLQDAMASIKVGLKCDPNNPDAQLIQQQLDELLQQQEQQQQEQQQQEQQQQEQPSSAEAEAPAQG